MSLPSQTPQEPGPDVPEGDRERLGILVILGMIGLIALCGLVFYVAGNAAGIAFIVIVAIAAGALALRWDRRGPVEIAAAPAGDDARRRVLVVALEGTGADAIAAALAENAPAAGTIARVVVPATASPAHRLASDTDAEAGRAERDLEGLLTLLRGQVDAVDGEVGDSDPRLALEDALRTFPASQVLVAVPSGEAGSRDEQQISDRLGDVRVPVREILV